jgi:hypothetical protein
MVFKRLGYSIILLVLFQSTISCQQNAKQQSVGDKKSETVDSIVFKTSNEKFIYLANRLYPTTVDFNDNAIAELMQSDIISIESVGDTIFVFLNKDLMHNQLNQNLPEMNDSLFKNFYPRHYNVVIDDDIPYMVYLKNDKDIVQIIRNRKGVFCWETATIKDTVLSFYSGIKVGMSKDEVFLKLNMPKIGINKKNFSLILCHASVPSEIWYKQMFKSKGYRLKTDKPNIQVLFNFKEGKLDSIYLNPWIGYGNKASSSI